MAVTYSLTDGSTTITLYALTAGVGIAVRLDKLPRMEYSFPAEFSASGGAQFAEKYGAVLVGSSHDNYASQFQSFIALLRKAVRYGVDPRQTTPVYLTAKTANETGTRYALVLDCPEIRATGELEHNFDAQNLTDNLEFTLVREAWRSGVPGTLPTALTLTATDGPASPTTVHVSNHKDDAAISHIFNYDSSLTTYSSNLAASSSFDLFSVSGSTPALNDEHLIGADDPFHHVVWNITTAGSYSVTWRFQYWNGSSWTNISGTTQRTVFPYDAVSIAAGIFSATGQWAVNIGPLGNWATTSVNGVTKYWLKILIFGFTSWTTTPAQGSQLVYIQKTPQVNVPSQTGDIPPSMLFRMRFPDGGDDTEDFQNLSRIIIGAKSRGTNFYSHLNWGGVDLPSGWSLTAGTDASTSADDRASAGTKLTVSFATQTGLGNIRATIQNDNILDDYEGTYRVFLRCQQVGGAAGDLDVRVRGFVYQTTLQSYSPMWRSEIVALQGVGQGWELVDMGILSLPFIRTITSDDLTGAGVAFRLQARRNTGAATFEANDLILMPIDEWSVDLRDPVIDTTDGSSALRGFTALDLDAGVLKNRTMKYVIHQTSGDFLPSETWERHGPGPGLRELDTATKLYFLMGHYPTTWGTPPLIGTLGCHLTFTAYSHRRWLQLRGAE